MYGKFFFNNQAKITSLYTLCLGEAYMKSVGLDLRQEKPTMYDESLMPQLSLEFAGSAFRVPHNVLLSIYK